MTIIAIRAAKSAVAIALVLAAVTQIQSAHASDEDNAIMPGKSVGHVRLGMKEGKVTQLIGKDEGGWSAPSGIKVVSYQRKDPNADSTIRVFYDRDDKVAQIASVTPIPATADGISLTASVAEVKRKFKNIERFQYKGKDERVDYYEDSGRGIAFKFVWSEEDEKPKKSLQSIVVFWPGNHIIPDSDEINF
jgi:hypothetical protein